MLNDAVQTNKDEDLKRFTWLILLTLLDFSKSLSFDPEMVVNL